MEVAERISARAKELSEEEKRRLMAPQGAIEPTTVRRRAELKAMHDYFVVNEADKESGVYTFRCKANYYITLDGALRAGTTYDTVGEGAESGRRRAGELNKFAEAQAKLRADERKPADPALMAMDDTAYHRRLRADFDFCTKMGMLKRGTGDNSPIADETDEQHFVRTHGLAQQYGSMKTHKKVPSERQIAGGTSNSLEEPNTWLSRAMWELKPHVDELFGGATASIEGRLLPGRFAVSPSYQSWIVGQSQEASHRVVRNLNAQMRRHREWARQEERGAEPQRREWPAPRREQSERSTPRRSGPLRCSDVDFSVYDFTTLFPSLNHAVIRRAKTLIRRIFAEQARKLNTRIVFLRVERNPDGRDAEAVRWAAERGQDKGSLRYFGVDEVEVLLDYILDSAHVTFGDTVFRQRLGVPIGFGTSPMIANLALAQCELEGIEAIVYGAPTARLGPR